MLELFRPRDDDLRLTLLGSAASLPACGLPANNFIVHEVTDLVEFFERILASSAIKALLEDLVLAPPMK